MYDMQCLSKVIAQSIGRFNLHNRSTSEYDIQNVIQRALYQCHSSAEGVALGRVQGGHLEAAPHAGPRPLAGHHGLQEVGARLIVLLPQLPLVPQARLHHVEAGALQGRLGVLQADGEGRQLQQVILKVTRSYKEVLSHYLI